MRRIKLGGIPLKNKEILIKIYFYLISLAPLFFLLAILTIEWKGSLYDNAFAILMVILIVISLIAMLLLGDLRKNSKELPIIITDITEINYENLVFLTTYIVPLVAIPLNTVREKIVFVFLLLFIGIIYIKTNVYYTNPSLAILGYNIYEINDRSGKHKSSVIIIKGTLKKNERIKCLKLSNNIYYGMKMNERRVL